MKLLLWLIAIFTAAVAVTMLAGVNDGYALFVVPPYRLDISLNALIILIIAAFIVVYGLFRLTFNALELPKHVKAYHRKRNQETARTALFDALEAFFEGRYNRAERDANKVAELEDDPRGKALASLLAARSAHIVRDFDKRDGYLSQAGLADQHAKLARYITQAELLADQRESTAALDALEEAKSIAPKLTNALRLELKIRQQRGEPDAVLRILEQLQKSDAIDSATAQTIRLASYLHILKHEPMNVRSLREWWGRLDKTDRLQPRLAAAAARKLLQLGDAELATDILINALEHDWDTELIEIFGNLHHSGTHSNDNLLKLIQQAESWLPQHPKDAALLLTLGRLCHAQQLWGKAQSYLEASLAVSPSVVAHIELAQLLEHIGKHEQAAQHFKKSLSHAMVDIVE
ncbi:heme biosynthesis HemY N-terminal domain-containing protein [Chitinivorax sp. B]|uniref:heme biosynthesis HemY N-terminal domain-containing protein n=1 Tax=Chitinivorax sp. B TaxID=2502235 RepID=UPI0010F7A3B3|nr:heme biosynthesis HemY N-terminal domain-containing protein [Chitinivorax sp. B]